MTAGNEFQTGGGSHLVGRDQIGSLDIDAVDRLHRTGHHPGKFGAGGVQKKVLSVVVERDAPGVGHPKLSIVDQFSALRSVAIKYAVVAAHGAVRRFHVGVAEQAFRHHDRAGRIGAKRGDGVVGIVVVEPAQ